MIYIVIAHQWNDPHNHSYLVGCNTKLRRAIKMAEQECFSKEGKYSCWVYECNECDNTNNVVYKAVGTDYNNV